MKSEMMTIAQVHCSFDDLIDTAPIFALYPLLLQKLEVIKTA